MYYESDVLGHYQAEKLRHRTASHVLSIGSDRFTRADLAKVECFNFVACARLEAHLKTLKVKHLKDVFDNVKPEELAAPQIGVISLAVLGAAFEAKGIGGGQPLANYLRKHLDNHTFTFDTLKERQKDHDNPKKRRGLSAKAKRQRPAPRRPVTTRPSEYAQAGS